MTSKVKINEAGMRRLVEGIQQKIKDADVRFRAEFAGKDVAEIEPRVGRWFADIGVQLQPGQIADYAKAVAEERHFEWVLI
ncbi:hypothetical protein [Microbacterium arabinogalactanolyticum]|uniref:hypothetical protein n=1 Tax=Microbacterium arabinogalactanolyticum TaxID=69365 RepID=UPI0025551987|nr:hypothetical protein [Microbacterium arabinogalactanolyticum]GLC86175.1 hypothetical protein MIAR_27600 [Microbacterium arabinogalactanolyticum]